MLKILTIFGFLIATVRGQQGSIQAPFAPTPTFNNNPLRSEAYSEGECIVPAIAPSVDPNFMITQRTFYVPIASQFAHRRYAETLLSRPPNSESELQSMCLVLDFFATENGLNVTNQGFDDREFRQNCGAIGLGHFRCFAMGSTGGVNPVRTASTEDSIVATDNQSYALVVRCVDGFFRDYKLITTRPTVSSELYNTVLNITRNLGFDDRRLQIMSYNNCPQIQALTSSNILRNNQRTRSPLDFSPFAAPFAQNPVGFSFGNTLEGFGSLIRNAIGGAFGSGLNPGAFGAGPGQTPGGFGGSGPGGFGPGQPPRGFQLGQNGGPFGPLSQNGVGAFGPGFNAGAFGI